LKPEVFSAFVKSHIDLLDVPALVMGEECDTLYVHLTLRGKEGLQSARNLQVGPPRFDMRQVVNGCGIDAYAPLTKSTRETAKGYLGRNTNCEGLRRCYLSKGGFTAVNKI
jgi:hypothetical protein